MLDENELLRVIRESLRAISEPRFFQSERGFQGEFLSVLRARLPDIRGLDSDVIIEQEYQKRAQEHGLTIRPDLIIHVPFDARRYPDRKHGNYIVFELKLRASPNGARVAFSHIARLMEILHYTLGVFINIGSSETHFSEVVKPATGRVAAFGVTIENGQIEIGENVT
ncbi:MAG: hypothetical protein V3R24_03915 [Gemmatimonadales bacterium]